MADPAPMYEKHIFICINERDEGHPRGSCGRVGGWEIRNQLAQLTKKHGLKGRVRANKSQCLDVCEQGPAVVCYPEGVWYTDVKPEDVQEIFETTVLGDGVVERLVATGSTWERQKELRSASDKMQGK